MSQQLKFILGVVGSDVHCVANQLIERELRSLGHATLNLGVALNKFDILQSLTSSEHDILLLGTINGDIEPTIEVIKAIRKEFGSNHTIIVGGNFTLGEIGKDRSLDLIRSGASKLVSNASSVSEAVQRIIQYVNDDSKVVV
jgi:methylaspartate mutase sigma subunit